jgi:site-specific DNA recombinase
MSLKKTKAKPIRFAALTRVSTEKQKLKGESLNTQKTQIESAVESLGGVIAARYAGQEHATAGWGTTKYEREQLDKLLADAERKPRPFDAVIVADTTRWSRDNVSNETGLKRLMENGIGFYVLVKQYDLFDPHDWFILAMSASIGALHAQTQKQKSLLNRIERAKRGVPTCGKLPFGRLYDREKGKWSVDPDAKKMIEDIATRYLAGESMLKLSAEVGLNNANLIKILRERCGDRWDIEFRADDLKINETVTLKIPHLLPDKTILAIRQRLEANRTYLHGQPTKDYLLSGRVFCAVCNYVMFGQENRQGHLYYRHGRREGAKHCTLNPRPWVRADVIEKCVLGKLEMAFGNPAIIERAMKAAIPDFEKVTKRRERIEADLKKIEASRDRVLDMVIRDSISSEAADKKCLALKEREALLKAELEKMAETLGNVPDAEELRDRADRAREFLSLDFGEHPYADLDDPRRLTWNPKTGTVESEFGTVGPVEKLPQEDKRRLIEIAFAGNLPDGKPCGVYVRQKEGAAHRPKTWEYEIRGLLIEPIKGVAHSAYP